MRMVLNCASNKGIKDAIHISDGLKYFTNKCQNLTFPWGN